MSKFNPKNFYDLEAEEEGNGSPNNKNESGDKVNNYNLNDSLIDNSNTDQVDQNKFDNMQKFLEDETKEDEKLFSRFLNPDQNQKEDDQIDDFQPISSSMPEPEFTFGINKKERKNQKELLNTRKRKYDSKKIYTPPKLKKTIQFKKKNPKKKTKPENDAQSDENILKYFKAKKNKSNIPLISQINQILKENKNANKIIDDDNVQMEDNTKNSPIENKDNLDKNIVDADGNPILNPFLNNNSNDNQVDKNPADANDSNAMKNPFENANDKSVNFFSPFDNNKEDEKDKPKEDEGNSSKKEVENYYNSELKRLEISHERQVKRQMCQKALSKSSVETPNPFLNIKDDIRRTTILEDDDETTSTSIAFPCEQKVSSLLAFKNNKNDNNNNKKKNPFTNKGFSLIGQKYEDEEKQRKEAERQKRERARFKNLFHNDLILQSTNKKAPNNKKKQ